MESFSAVIIIPSGDRREYVSGGLGDLMLIRTHGSLRPSGVVMALWSILSSPMRMASFLS